jgi:hypothetical protein
MSVTRYATIVLPAVALSLVLVLVALGSRVGSRDFAAAVLGAALATANSVAAYFLLRWSAGRSHVMFFRAVLGGMLARMLFLLGSVAAALTAFDLPAPALIASLVGYFALLLVFELAAASRIPASSRTQPS